MVTVGDKAFFDKIHQMPEAGLVFKRHYSPRFVRLTAAFVNQAGDRNQDHVYELSVVSNGPVEWLATATVDGHFIFHLTADSKSRAEALGFWALKGHLCRALRRTIRANRAKEVARKRQGEVKAEKQGRYEMNEYEPYGPAWAREVGRLTKAQLIAMLTDVGRGRARLARRLAEVGDIVRGAMSSQLLKFAGYDVASASRNPRMKDLCEKAHSIIQIAKEGN